MTEDNPFAYNSDADDAPAVTLGAGDFDPSLFVSPQRLHTVSRILLIVFCLVSFLSIGSSVLQAVLLNEAKMGPGPNFEARAEANDLRELAVSLLTLGVHICAGIASLKLLHRLRSNVDHLGARGLDCTPGWSIGWFFVPIANLWKPLGATRQTWQASISPNSWSSVEVPGTLGTWWLFWIVASIAGRVSSRYLRIAGEGIDALITSTWLDAGAVLLTLIAAVCYMSVLKQMTETQVDTLQRMTQGDRY